MIPDHKTLHLFGGCSWKHPPNLVPDKLHSFYKCSGAIHICQVHPSKGRATWQGANRKSNFIHSQIDIYFIFKTLYKWDFVFFAPHSFSIFIFPSTPSCLSFPGRKLSAVYDRARRCSWYCMLCFQPLDDSNSRLQPFELWRTIQAMKSIWELEAGGKKPFPSVSYHAVMTARVCVSLICVFGLFVIKMPVCENRQEGDVWCWLQNLLTWNPAIKATVLKKQLVAFSKQLDPSFPLAYMRCDS